MARRIASVTAPGQAGEAGAANGKCCWDAERFGMRLEMSTRGAGPYPAQGRHPRGQRDVCGKGRVFPGWMLLLGASQNEP